MWDLCWSADMPDLLAIMEKTRMYILRGIEPEVYDRCGGTYVSGDEGVVSGIEAC